MKLKEIKKALERITIAPSAINIAFKWKVKKQEDGFLICTTFQRPDTNSGKMGEGYGRWMFLDKTCDERSVIMTAWLCMELIVRHELMESMLVDGVRILDPHKSLDALAYPHELKKAKTRK